MRRVKRNDRSPLRKPKHTESGFAPLIFPPSPLTNERLILVLIMKKISLINQRLCEFCSLNDILNFSPFWKIFEVLSQKELFSTKIDAEHERIENLPI